MKTRCCVSGKKEKREHVLNEVRLSGFAVVIQLICSVGLRVSPVHGRHVTSNHRPNDRNVSLAQSAYRIFLAMTCVMHVSTHGCYAIITSVLRQFTRATGR